MTSVRSDLESIVQDTKWCALFEDRLKKSYNYQNLAFWVSLRDLKTRLDTEEVASEGVQERMETIMTTFFDTESAQAVGLSFKAKERFKRSRTQPAPEVKKAADQAQHEVEVLLAAEVKTFLADAPPPAVAKSPRMTQPPNFMSPRGGTSSSATSSPAATRVDRAQSEAVRELSPAPLGSGEYGRGSGTTASAGGSATGSSASPAQGPLSPVTATRASLVKSKDSGRSYSVSTNVAPPAKLVRALSKGSGNVPGAITSKDAAAAAAVVAAANANGGMATASGSGPVTKAVRSYPFDVTPSDAPFPRAYATEMAAFAWGDNAMDQLGAPGAERSVALPLPLPAPLNVNVVFVQCSETYSVAVDGNGQAYCAGKAVESTAFVPILEGHVVRQLGCGLQFCIALLDTGRLLYYGFANRAIEKLPLPETVIKITCGARHCVALTNQGHVYTWGSDERKQLGHGAAERVPKPMHLLAVEEALDVAAGRNSSACVTASGQVLAWGAVVASVRPEVVPLEELRTRNIFRISCSDRFVVGVSDLGRVFLWHPDAVVELSIPTTPNPVVCLRSASVMSVVCHDALLVALTDTGDVITWGDYSPALGQGARSTYKRYAETPRRLPELQSMCVRHVAASPAHVLAVTGDGTSRREELLWELFARERQYGRALYAIVDEYSRRIKIKDTPNLFRNAKLLQDYHTALLRELIKALEAAPKGAFAEVGLVYATCFGTPELSELYRTWAAETAIPLEKLSRPKLASQLGEIELEVETVTKKTDSRAELAKSFSLLSLLREPPRHLQASYEQLQLLLRETAPEHPDYVPLQRALGALVSASGGAFGGASASPSSASPAPSAASPAAPAATDTMRKGSSASADDESMMQDRLRLRALQTELDIFRDANVQLVRYALALEDEVVRRGGGDGKGALNSSSGSSTSTIARSGATAATAAAGGLESLQAWEEEMLEIARENGELRAKLRLMDVYRAQAIGAPSPDEADSSTLDSRDSADSPGPGSRPGRGTPSLGKAKSGSLPVGSPSATSRKVTSGLSYPSPSMRGSTAAASESSPLNASNSSINGIGASDEESAKLHEALRKRINPAAGRLLSEGEGGAARSLEQFTFDDSAPGAKSNGVVYQGTDLKAATLEKLLEHITQSSGSLALDTFLISYRNFASPQDVLRRLVYMYCKAPPAKAKVVWVRVLNFLKSWCVKFFEEDWENNEPLKTELFSFLDEIVIPSFPNSADKLVSSIREKVSGTAADRTQAARTAVPARPTQPPAVATHKPNVIAEQMIMSEHENFRAIKPGECFNQNWVKKNSGLSPNIVNLTNRFNKLSRWVAYEICVCPDIRERRVMLEKWIAVASLCKEQYRAFGIVMVIVGGLTSSAVFRLRRTWESLGRAQMATFNDLKEFTKSENNFSTLREATRIAELPCYPYIGTYLGDLTFIDAGSADYTSDGLINWAKFISTANTLLQLQAKQKTAYTFELVPEWQQFLYHVPDHSEQDLYDLSKRAEASAPTK